METLKKKATQERFDEAYYLLVNYLHKQKY